MSSAGTTTLAYDYEGRATSISGPGVSQTNAYNGLDTRVGSTTNSASQTFLRDGAHVTAPVLSDGAATYTPGLSEQRGGATTFAHSGPKSADAQSSTAQTVIATRQYDAFGNVADSSGTFSGPVGYGGSFGYQEDTTDLNFLGHRYYDSSTGRFLTRDPLKDGRNWYVYCGNDPVGRADADGRVWIEVRFRELFFPGSGIHHMLIVIIDNVPTSPTFGQMWIIEAGPAREGGFVRDRGPVKSKPIPEKGVPSDGSAGPSVLLVDNQNPAAPYVDQARDIANSLDRDNARYDKHGPNSNTFVKEVLIAMGLWGLFLDEVDEKFGDKRPGVPGVNKSFPLRGGPYRAY